MCFDTQVDTSGAAEVARQQLEQMRLNAAAEEKRYQDAQKAIADQKAAEEAARLKAEADRQSALAAEKAENERLAAEEMKQKAAQQATGAAAVKPAVASGVAPALALASLGGGTPGLETMTQKAARLKSQQSQSNTLTSPTLYQGAY